MAYNFEFICINAIDIVKGSTSLTFQYGITCKPQASSISAYQSFISSGLLSETTQGFKCAYFKILR